MRGLHISAIWDRISIEWAVILVQGKEDRLLNIGFLSWRRPSFCLYTVVGGAPTSGVCCVLPLEVGPLTTGAPFGIYDAFTAFSSVDKGRVGDALDVGVGEESALDC